MKKVVLIVVLISLASYAWAQRICSTTDLNNLNKTNEQILIEQQAFENWLQEKRAQFIQQNALQGPTDTTIYNIPLVLHIIYNS